MATQRSNQTVAQKSKTIQGPKKETPERPDWDRDWECPWLLDEAGQEIWFKQCKEYAKKNQMWKDHPWTLNVLKVGFLELLKSTTPLALEVEKELLKWVEINRDAQVLYGSQGTQLSLMNLKAEEKEKLAQETLWKPGKPLWDLCAKHGMKKEEILQESQAWIQAYVHDLDVSEHDNLDDISDAIYDAESRMSHKNNPKQKWLKRVYPLDLASKEKQWESRWKVHVDELWSLGIKKIIKTPKDRRASLWVAMMGPEMMGLDRINQNTKAKQALKISRGQRMNMVHWQQWMEQLESIPPQNKNEWEGVMKGESFKLMKNEWDEIREKNQIKKRGMGFEMAQRDSFEPLLPQNQRGIMLGEDEGCIDLDFGVDFDRDEDIVWEVMNMDDHWSEYHNEWMDLHSGFLFVPNQVIQGLVGQGINLVEKEVFKDLWIKGLQARILKQWESYDDEGRKNAWSWSGLPAFMKKEDLKNLKMGQGMERVRHEIWEAIKLDWIKNKVTHLWKGVDWTDETQRKELMLRVDSMDWKAWLGEQLNVIPEKKLTEQTSEIEIHGMDLANPKVIACLEALESTWDLTMNKDLQWHERWGEVKKKHLESGWTQAAWKKLFNNMQWVNGLDKNKKGHSNDVNHIDNEKEKQEKRKQWEKVGKILAASAQYQWSDEWTQSVLKGSLLSKLEAVEETKMEWTFKELQTWFNSLQTPGMLDHLSIENEKFRKIKSQNDSRMEKVLREWGEAAKRIEEKNKEPKRPGQKKKALLKPESMISSQMQLRKVELDDMKMSWRDFDHEKDMLHAIAKCHQNWVKEINQSLLEKISYQPWAPVLNKIMGKEIKAQEHVIKVGETQVHAVHWSKPQWPEHLEVLELNNRQSLVWEGKSMSHCVASYADQAKSNQFIGLHLTNQKTGKRSTLSYQKHGDKWMLFQHFGPHNENVSDEGLKWMEGAITEAINEYRIKSQAPQKKQGNAPARKVPVKKAAPRKKENDQVPNPPWAPKAVRWPF